MRKFASIIVVLALVLCLPGCNKDSIADPVINGEETVSEEIINPITQEELYGEYICEEPGFGGMFTLTLQEDGMFSYYEGSLSSYIGYGSWDYSENKLTLKDTGYGEEWDIFFTVIDGCLVYDKEPSHTFIYADLNDGTRFVPKEQINDE